MIIDTGAPSSDHYCIDVVVPSSDHCYTERAPTERVPPSSDHCYTETVPPYAYFFSARKFHQFYIQLTNFVGYS